MTALPIIETQAGDVSAHILMIHHDGLIWKRLFFSGMRPAVNVGLSVSRVGGAAQNGKAIKKHRTLCIDLARFRTASLHPVQLGLGCRNQDLDHGKNLMEILKQPLYQPKPVKSRWLSSSDRRPAV